MSDSYRMRVRIKRPLEECIDGVRLDCMVVGREYDVGVSLGCYLLAIEAVDLIDDSQMLSGRERGTNGSPEREPGQRPSVVIDLEKTFDLGRLTPPKKAD